MGVDLQISFMGSTKSNVFERLQEIREALWPRKLTKILRPRVIVGRYSTLERLDTNISDSELEELVRTTLQSRSHLILDFSSELLRPYLVTFYLQGGEGFPGAHQAVVGPLKATIPMNQFRFPESVDERPWWEKRRSPRRPYWDYESAYTIFAELVGLKNDRMRALGVEHAMGYVDRRDPHASSMIYHADIDGFALDFEVLHHRYHKGSTSFILYSDDKDKPSEEVLEKVREKDYRFYWPISREIEEYPDLYLRNYLYRSEEDLHEFFQRIDDEAITYFQGLSSEELAFKVELAAEETGWIWMPATVGNGGAVVGTLHGKYNIIRNLIVFYEKLLDMYDEERAGVSRWKACKP